MRNFWEQFKDSMQRVMYGRYGTDELGTAIFGVSIIVWVIACIIRVRILRTLACVGIFIALIRMYSRNTEQRRMENQSFLEKFEGPIKWYVLQKQKLRDRKTHKYFKCDQCKAVLRVPKGRGKIEVTCPKCGAKSIRKS